MKKKTKKKTSGGRRTSSISNSQKRYAERGSLKTSSSLAVEIYIPKRTHIHNPIMIYVLGCDSNWQ